MHITVLPFFQVYNFVILSIICVCVQGPLHSSVADMCGGANELFVGDVFGRVAIQTSISTLVPWTEYRIRQRIVLISDKRTQILP